MYETTKEIDTRFKIFRFIHFQEFLILLVTTMFLYFNLKKINIWLKIPYFTLGLSFVIYLIKNSPDNIGKKNAHSILFAFKRNKETVKSIERNTFAINNLKRTLKRKKLKIKKSTLDYIDFSYFTENGYIKHKTDDIFIEILQIDTIDVSNLNSNHIDTIIYENAQFYRKYTDDIKIISMNFPCDYKEQIEYFTNKLDTVSNDFRKKFLTLKIKELEYLQSTKYNLEFYLMIFIDGEKNISSDIERIKLEFPNKLNRIPLDKKEKILFKLNNMNTNI